MTDMTMRSPSDLTGRPTRRRCLVCVLLTLASPSIASRALAADPAPPADVPSEADMPGFALNWFTEMQAGRLNRAQYAPAYAAQLTDDAGAEMSKQLNQYGASPVRAEVLGKRVMADQTFYEVKMIFPRGDLSALLFGFEVRGKITGVAVMSMAGE